MKPDWRISKDGYVYCYHEGKKIWQHRLVMQRKLRRRLRRGEEVHHINFIRHDNRPSNLRLFKTRAEHQAFHAALKRKPR